MRAEFDSALINGICVLYSGSGDPDNSVATTAQRAIYLKDDGSLYTKAAGTDTWVLAGTGGGGGGTIIMPYDLAIQRVGAPEASEVILRFVAARAFTLPGTGNVGKAGTAATAQTDFAVKVNGTTKATMRFAISGTVASVVSPTSADIVAGDVITVEAPATPDATLADLEFTLVGTITMSPPIPYDVAAQSAGLPSASEVLMRFVAPRNFTFPGTGSVATAAVAATAQTDFAVKVNGTLKTTLRFAASGTSASVVSPTSADIVAGDVVTIEAPSSPDATLADLGFTLLGTVS